ncbi:MAG: hypothetical protein HY271_21310 [Deltaproteobacteria bacterium]|nr:hypothetical protein [Deltaproteobacteria bacterium]
MSISAKCTVIGLTGPFGSGCSQAAQKLVAAAGFTRVPLSRAIRERFTAEHPDIPPRREDLQRLGNQMRRDAGVPGLLAREAIATLESDGATYDKLVFDSIRNLGEVEVLRDRFGGNFYLVAIHCGTSDRWERLKDEHYISKGLTLADFTADDARDKNEEDDYGQQVELCVDAADLFVNNSIEVNPVQLGKKLLADVQVLTGDKPRYALPLEIYMNFAYSAAHASKCIKRQVGAVLVTAPPGEHGDIVGTGYNENPAPTKPCVEEPEYGAGDATRGRCYRDIVRQEVMQRNVDSGWHCPKCAAPLVGPISDTPPWFCSGCGASLDKLFWPDRAMSVCTAVHAETAVLLAAGTRARNATLYTTSLPCFQCTEKIIHAGVKYIVFTEPYPDALAADRLELGAIEVGRFEGVRSRRFHEIFSRARRYVEGQPIATTPAS